MLTHRDLKTIQEGNRRHPDVMTLLREVKRLRDLVARAYAMTSRIPMNLLDADTSEMIAFFDALRAEPAVIEHERMRQKQEQLEFRRKQAMEKRSCADASVKKTTIPNTSK